MNRARCRCAERACEVGAETQEMVKNRALPLQKLDSSFVELLREHRVKDTKTSLSPRGGKPEEQRL